MRVERASTYTLAANRSACTRSLSESRRIFCGPVVVQRIGRTGLQGRVICLFQEVVPRERSEWSDNGQDRVQQPVSLRSATLRINDYEMPLNIEHRTDSVRIRRDCTGRRRNRGGDARDIRTQSLDPPRAGSCTSAPFRLRRRSRLRQRVIRQSFVTSLRLSGERRRATLIIRLLSI
jgi:hypothetical protein